MVTLLQPSVFRNNYLYFIASTSSNSTDDLNKTSNTPESEKKVLQKRKTFKAPPKTPIMYGDDDSDDDFQ